MLGKPLFKRSSRTSPHELENFEANYETSARSLENFGLWWVAAVLVHQVETKLSVKQTIANESLRSQNQHLNISNTTIQTIDSIQHISQTVGI